MLAYIDARIVQNRLDEVVGFENWQCKHISYGPKTICHLGIKLNGDGYGNLMVQVILM